MKRKIISESLEEYERRLGLILASDALTDSQKKEALNRTRRDAMLQFSFYSPQMEHVDNFIRQRLREPRRATESRTGGNHGKTDGLQHT